MYGRTDVSEPIFKSIPKSCSLTLLYQLGRFFRAVLKDVGFAAEGKGVSLHEYKFTDVMLEAPPKILEKVQGLEVLLCHYENCTF